MATDSRGDRGSDPDLAVALHEVSNGLTVVLGWLEMLDALSVDGAAVAPEVVREAVSVALSRARTAHHVARKAIGAASTASAAPLELPVLAADCVRSLAPLAKKAGVLLELDSQADLAFEVPAAAELQQALTNLLLNAVAVTPRGGAVRLSTRVDSRTQPTSCTLTVEDAGSGIPPEQRPHLFRRGASTRAGGAGIGLAHAQELALQQGGAITIAPFAPGKGARFELSWPLGSEVSSRAPLTKRPAQLEGLRIVILDDDAGVLELLDTVLTTRGAKVHAVRSLRALHEALLEEAADIALVDASPIAGDLRAELTALRSAFPATGLVLISGAPDPGAIAVDLGMIWIRKPFEISEIIEVLRLLRPAGIEARV